MKATDFIDLKKVTRIVIILPKKREEPKSIKQTRGGGGSGVWEGPGSHSEELRTVTGNRQGKEKGDACKSENFRKVATVRGENSQKT